jgi:hypothetical protein
LNQLIDKQYFKQEFGKFVRNSDLVFALDLYESALFKNADFMFKKLLNLLFESHLGNPEAAKNSTGHQNEECKFSIFGLIVIVLKNPSAEVIRLARLFMIIIALIIITMICHGYNIKGIPAVKQADSLIRLAVPDP